MAINYKKFLAIVPVVAGISLFTAYRDGHLNGLIGDYGKLRGGAPAAAKRVTLTPADQALSDKLQPLITCINRVDTTMQENIRLYRKQLSVLNANPIDPNWGLTVDRFRSFKIAPYEQANSLSVECAAGLDKAAVMAPKDDELDTVARDYAVTLRALLPFLNEADTYYGQKDYTDDKMAKGRKLDVSIAPLFDALIKHSSVMRHAVGDRNDKLRAAQLEVMERERGRDIEWHTLNVMIASRRSFMSLQGAIERKTLSKDVVATAEQTLQKAFEDAKLMATNLSMPVEGSKERKPIWFDVDAPAASYLASVKTLRRELEAGKPQVIVGYALDSIVRQYNGLVSSHNRASRI